MRRLVLLVAVAGAPAWADGPAPGRYEAQLCVTAAASAPPSCGPAELDVRSATRAEVRVADIVYRLYLRPPQVDVATMHGSMQIDEFSSEYEWQGEVLRFVDADKKASYEVKAGARIRTSR